jgi:hypothetical protein
MSIFGIEFKKPSFKEIYKELFFISLFSFFVFSYFDATPRDHIMTIVVISTTALLSIFGISPYGSIKKSFVYFGFIIITCIPLSLLLTYIYS